MPSKAKLELEQAIEKWMDDYCGDIEFYWPERTSRRIVDIIEQVIDFSADAQKAANS